MYGELVPLGGGDPIPLLKKTLLVGRRESCDIVLRFSNVSAHHCQLTVNGGYWYVKDLKSRNGVKVNHVQVTEKLLMPGDELAVARHKYRIQYSPVDLGAVSPPPSDQPNAELFRTSLLERAGLAHRKERPAAPVAGEAQRYDVSDDRAGQLQHDRNRPV